MPVNGTIIWYIFFIIVIKIRQFEHEFISTTIFCGRQQKKESFSFDSLFSFEFHGILSQEYTQNAIRALCRSTELFAMQINWNVQQIEYAQQQQQQKIDKYYIANAGQKNVMPELRQANGDLSMDAMTFRNVNNTSKTARKWHLWSNINKNYTANRLELNGVYHKESSIALENPCAQTVLMALGLDIFAVCFLNRTSAEQKHCGRMRLVCLSGFSFGQYLSFFTMFEHSCFPVHLAISIVRSFLAMIDHHFLNQHLFTKDAVKGRKREKRVVEETGNEKMSDWECRQKQIKRKRERRMCIRDSGRVSTNTALPTPKGSPNNDFLFSFFK